MSDRLVSPELLDVSSRIYVAPDRSHATVGGRRLDAASPRELRHLLADALYHELHAGLSLGENPLPFRLRDATFEEELGQAVPHQETTLHGRVRAVGDDAHVIELSGVRVRVPADQIRSDGPVTLGGAVKVANTSLRPALSPGFFVVEGAQARTSTDVLRVYVHITEWTAAAKIWHTALSYLEAHKVTYRAKVVSSKLLYPRRDALVVYLHKPDRHAAGGLADAVGDLPGVGTQTSVFARRLRPGVATAWEPRDPLSGTDRLSFGQHRASVLAKALVEAAGAAELSAGVLRGFLLEANIDPVDPSRNADAPDV
ncbi:T3SS effector HopA1 family protein [Streptomyces sp. NPDC048595]|uniref:T3SS effector HopA1 family protein n=1 Tax=Streptomyces sp. NPDC048595 TaxID=3365576 RepID=UPI003712DDD9